MQLVDVTPPQAEDLTTAQLAPRREQGASGNVDQGRPATATSSLGHGRYRRFVDRAQERVQAEDVSVRWTDWAEAYRAAADAALTRP